MNINDLYELVVSAPTGGAETNALSVLNNLARDGDLAAAQALLRALAPALDCDSALPAITAATSMNELLAAEFPAPLRAYAVALEPRTFIANVEQMPKRPDENYDIRKFKRLVITRDVLQHEALKAHVLTALSGVLGMMGRMSGTTPGHFMRVLDRVLADTCVVEGRDSDAKLRFGREMLLMFNEIGSLYGMIFHELGHNVFDLTVGRGTEETSSGHESAMSDLAAALPRLMEAACQRHGQKFEMNEPRRLTLAKGVTLLCSHERAQSGSYFHLSLMQGAGPIDLQVGASYAYLVLTLAGINPSDAAVAYSPRGALHFGFRGEEQDRLRAAPPSEVASARIQEALTNGPTWIDELRANRQLGESPLDVAIALGVEPRRPVLYGDNAANAFADLGLMAQVNAVPSFGVLGEQEAAAVLTAAWCTATPTVVQRLLREQPGMPAQLREAGWPLSEIGASIYAIRDEHRVVSLHGPTVSDIGAVLLALRDSGIPLDGPADRDGRTLLIRAVFKDEKLVRLALDCGADPNRASEDGETPLLACATVGNVAAAEALVAAGASVATPDRHGRTALHRATGEGQEELMRWLLAHGAKVDARDSDGNTALMFAQTSSAVEALCDAGAAATASSNVGLTALHYAAQHGNSEVARALLSRGADPNTPTRTGETPLHYAALVYEDVDCMAVLLDAGADIDEETNDGMTALMLAARDAQVKAVELLLERGADVDARSVNGDTALSLAQAREDKATIDALVAATQKKA
ncbi:MAG TPA: ankyrin repeat domain-containing protein [Pyrinomonadaceae bacterium]|nr:ankyrin repeat domain-containing protein [Pyrinomonadaceae bacterium]